jgi:hypothetical protein
MCLDRARPTSWFITVGGGSCSTLWLIQPTLDDGGFGFSLTFPSPAELVSIASQESSSDPEWENGLQALLGQTAEYHFQLVIVHPAVTSIPPTLEMHSFSPQNVSPSYGFTLGLEVPGILGSCLSQLELHNKEPQNGSETTERCCLTLWRLELKTPGSYLLKPVFLACRQLPLPLLPPT